LRPDSLKKFSVAFVGKAVKTKPTVLAALAVLTAFPTNAEPTSGDGDEAPPAGFQLKGWGNTIGKFTKENI
jgi:hypothetical protein